MRVLDREGTQCGDGRVQVCVSVVLLVLLDDEGSAHPLVSAAAPRDRGSGAEAGRVPMATSLKDRSPSSTSSASTPTHIFRSRPPRTRSDHHNHEHHQGLLLERARGHQGARRQGRRASPGSRGRGHARRPRCRRRAGTLLWSRCSGSCFLDHGGVRERDERTRELGARTKNSHSLSFTSLSPSPLSRELDPFRFSPRAPSALPRPARGAWPECRPALSRVCLGSWRA